MILLGDFFKITELQKNDAEINALLEINSGHRIFEGHFPGQPVVPGVCMMQMIKEIFEQVTGRATDIVKAHEMKFLVIINPAQNNIVQATLKYSTEENGDINISAGLSKDETIHFKFKGLLHFR